MSRSEIVRGEPVKFEDKTDILQSAFGLREIHASLPDGSSGRAIDEDVREAENRAYYNARADQERHGEDD
jgi:hypothetical protein